MPKRTRSYKRLPGANEGISPRVPPGVFPLSEAITITARRWNGYKVADGYMVAEALLAMAEWLVQRPEVTNAERLVITERAKTVQDALEVIYTEYLDLDRPAIRP